MARQHIERRVRERLKRTERLLAPCAQTAAMAMRRHNSKPEDIRSPYTRDADRILHSRAYTRYIDKTQVFYLVKNDHITHRVLHVQLVSKIARTIGRVFGLNEDCIEAIALGHDIGHAPYGHFGEQCLSSLCMEHGCGPFFHNAQSVAFLDRIEETDLTLQVLDGILCHNGESLKNVLEPEPCEDFASFDRRFDTVAAGGDIHPMTLEGCVVRFADTIAYIGRDLEDAREVGLIGSEDIAGAGWAAVLGHTNREIVDTLIWDLLCSSDCGEEPQIRYSAEVARALFDLRRFSNDHIYEHPALTAERGKIVGMYRTLFTTFLGDIETGREPSLIYQDFIRQPWVSPRYREGTDPVVLVRDFIAGMTDRYFEKCFKEIILPEKIEGRFSRHEKA
ncbi:MAG: HD domain-containing protein [Methanomicrobiales archaeon]|nr:HD domain-containing protein [Methanomicrobiales archaeon]